MTPSGPADELPPTTQSPMTAGQRLQASVKRVRAAAQMFKPGPTRRDMRVVEDGVRAAADYSRAAADVVERAGNTAQANDLRVGAERLTARADALSPEAMKRQRREQMAIPVQSGTYFRGPFMPRPLNRNWFTIWVLGFPWMLVRGLMPYCLIVALVTVVLGLASQTLLGAALGVVVGVPGVAVPVYGWCTRWRQNWLALLSTFLLPATIAALVVIANISR